MYCLAWTTLVAVLTAHAAEVTVNTLDGKSQKGEFKGWNDRTVTVATAEGEQQLPIKELLSLRWRSKESDTPEPAPAENDTVAAQIELTDGTILPINGFRSTSGKATATLGGSLAGETKDLTFVRGQLAAVRLRPLDPAIAAQWDEIRGMKAAGDLLVVLKRDGKSLDYVEGVLGNVGDEKIEFKLDAESAQIDRSKIAGIVYFQRDANTTVEPLCVVNGRDGLRAAARQVRIVDNNIQLTTMTGARMTLPLDAVSWIDFSAGKLLYLSDLDPASENWVPLVALPSGAGLAAAYGKSRRDQSAYGGPLFLSAAPPDASSQGSGARREFTKGLAVRSRTELLYRLPAGFRRFTATAGIDPATSATGNVRLQIFGDDRPLLETDVAGGTPPQDIDLDIADVKRLKIIVDYGENQDTGDWLNLCDAKVVK